MTETVAEDNTNGGYNPCYGHFANQGKEMHVTNDKGHTMALKDDEILKLYNGLKNMAGNH